MVQSGWNQGSAQLSGLSSVTFQDVSVDINRTYKKNIYISCNIPGLDGLQGNGDQKQQSGMVRLSLKSTFVCFQATKGNPLRGLLLKNLAEEKYNEFALPAVPYVLLKTWTYACPFPSILAYVSNYSAVQVVQADGYELKLSLIQKI